MKFDLRFFFRIKGVGNVNKMSRYELPIIQLVTHVNNYEFLYFSIQFINTQIFDICELFNSFTFSSVRPTEFPACDRFPFIPVAAAFLSDGCVERPIYEHNDKL